MVVEEFKDYLIYEKRFSVHTVEAYLKDIAQFSDFIKDLGVEHLFLVQVQHVRLWVVSLVEQGIKSTSIHRKLSSLNSFYKFSQKKGNLLSNPAKGIQLPKTPQRLPKYIEQKQLHQLFDQFDKDESNEFISWRDRVVLELFYNTGMRRQELIQLKWSDVNFSLKQIKILGKGGKERLVPISSELIDILQTYFKISNHTFDTFYSGGPVILTNKGEQSYPELIYRIVQQKLNEVDVKTQKSPHVLRHSFATHMTNEGAPLNDVKELLGHSSLSSTQIYTHNSIEKLKEIFKRSHPKA